MRIRRLATAGAALLMMAQAQAQAPAPTTAPTPPPPPAEQELIYHGEAASILGRMVRDRDDGMVGRIVDVLVDDTGQPRAAIVDAGGFMGMGTRRVAVAWRTLRFQTSAGRAGRIVLDMTLDQIKDIPEFKRSVSPADPPITVAVPPPPRPQPEPQSTPEPPPRP